LHDIELSLPTSESKRLAYTYVIVRKWNTGNIFCAGKVVTPDLVQRDQDRPLVGVLSERESAEEYEKAEPTSQ
jgi:hypothetical protein